MHILMVVSNPVAFDPRVLNEATSLVDHGHRVTVLGWDREDQFSAAERVDGVEILRVRNTPWMRLLPWDLLRLRPWWRLAYRRALAVHEEAGIDAVHCHDLDTLPSGVLLKKKLGVPLVYDAHEIWPEMIAKDLPAFISRHFSRLEKRLMRHVDRLIIAETLYGDYFESIDAPRTDTVLNTKSLLTTEYHPPQNEFFTLLYIGTLSHSRFLPQLVDVCGQLDDVKLIIGGIGKLYESVEARCRLYENVEFVGAVPSDSVLPLTLRSDAVCCMIDPDTLNNRIAAATKQFEAMVCGRPVICTKGTRSGEITSEEESGLVTDYTEEGLRRAIERLRDSPELREELGRNALGAAIRTYNWENEEGKLLDLHEEVGGIR